jgi:hypothetical protein
MSSVCGFAVALERIAGEKESLGGSVGRSAGYEVLFCYRTKNHNSDTFLGSERHRILFIGRRATHFLWAQFRIMRSQTNRRPIADRGKPEIHYTDPWLFGIIPYIALCGRCNDLSHA